MRCGRGTCGSRSASEVTTSAATPIGRLIQKIHCHPGPSASQPPNTGPRTLEVPKTAANQPW